MCAIRVYLLFTVALVLHYAASPVQSQNTGCTLPDGTTTATELKKLLISRGGAGSDLTVSLISQRFTCLIVQSREGYSYVSVVANYTKNSAVNESAHFQLKCGPNNVWQVVAEDPERNPPAAAFTKSRRDCRVCSSQMLPGVDTDTNCVRKYNDLAWLTLC